MDNRFIKQILISDLNTSVSPLSDIIQHFPCVSFVVLSHCLYIRRDFATLYGEDPLGEFTNMQSIMPPNGSDRYNSTLIISMEIMYARIMYKQHIDSVVVPSALNTAA